MNPLDSAPSSDELMSMESLKALVAANGARIACLCAKLGVKVDAPWESTPPPTIAPICVQGAVSASPVLVETSSTPALQPRIVPEPKSSTPTKCLMECRDEQDNETCQVTPTLLRDFSSPASVSFLSESMYLLPPPMRMENQQQPWLPPTHMKVTEDNQERPVPWPSFVGRPCQIVQDAKAKLETEVGPLDGMSSKMARGIVGRLPVAADVQKLCSLAMEKADDWLQSNSHAETKQIDTLPTAGRFRFEDITASSLVIVLKEIASSQYHAITGYKLWYWNSREPPSTAEPVIFPKDQRRILILNLQPCTKYAFRIISFADDGDKDSRCIEANGDSRGYVSTLDSSSDPVPASFSPPPIGAPPALAPRTRRMTAEVLSMHSDPGGSRYTCWVLNKLLDVNIWKEGNPRVLALELYIQWDPGIMQNNLVVNLESLMWPSKYACPHGAEVLKSPASSNGYIVEYLSDSSETEFAAVHTSVSSTTYVHSLVNLSQSMPWDPGVGALFAMGILLVDRKFWSTKSKPCNGLASSNGLANFRELKDIFPLDKGLYAPWDPGSHTCLWMTNVWQQVRGSSLNFRNLVLSFGHILTLAVPMGRIFSETFLQISDHHYLHLKELCEHFNISADQQLFLSTAAPTDRLESYLQYLAEMGEQNVARNSKILSSSKQNISSSKGEDKYELYNAADGIDFMNALANEDYIQMTDPLSSDASASTSEFLSTWPGEYFDSDALLREWIQSSSSLGTSCSSTEGECHNPCDCMYGKKPPERAGPVGRCVRVQQQGRGPRATALDSSYLSQGKRLYPASMMNVVAECLFLLLCFPLCSPACPCFPPETAPPSSIRRA